MATYSRELLSGTANGLPIPVAATATPGTLVHTATATGTDNVFLYASNVTMLAATLTVEWGGVTDPANLMCKALAIPANSANVQIALGQPVKNGVVIRAFSGTANAINLTGYVNRIV
jgi:hypothetical protein